MTQPIVVKDVEVIYIDHYLQYLAVKVYEPLLKQYDGTHPEVTEHIRDKVNTVVRYLIAEGFIPNIYVQNWIIDIVGVHTR